MKLAHRGGRERRVGKVGRPPLRRRENIGEYSEEEEVDEEEEEEDDEDQEGEIRCVCGKNVDQGLMISCDKCTVWQHGSCLGIKNENDVPDKWFCELCRSPKKQPTPVKPKKPKTPSFSFIGEKSLIVQLEDDYRAITNEKLKNGDNKKSILSTSLGRNVLEKYCLLYGQNKLASCQDDAFVRALSILLDCTESEIVKYLSSIADELSAFTDDRKTQLGPDPFVGWHLEHSNIYKTASNKNTFCEDKSCVCAAFNSVQFPKLSIRKNNHFKLFTLVAEEDIAKGRLIIEYIGQIAAAERVKRKVRNNTASLFDHDIPFVHFHTVDKDRELCLDARRHGNIARFVSHSCSPNAEPQVFQVHSKIHLGFYAKYDIKKGTIISIPFRFKGKDLKSTAKCVCNSENCRTAKWYKKRATQIVQRLQKPGSSLNASESTESDSDDMDSFTQHGSKPPIVPNHFDKTRHKSPSSRPSSPSPSSQRSKPRKPLVASVKSREREKETHRESSRDNGSHTPRRDSLSTSGTKKSSKPGRDASDKLSSREERKIQQLVKTIEKLERKPAPTDGRTKPKPATPASTASASPTTTTTTNATITTTTTTTTTVAASAAAATPATSEHTVPASPVRRGVGRPPNRLKERAKAEEPESPRKVEKPSPAPSPAKLSKLKRTRKEYENGSTQTPPETAKKKQKLCKTQEKPGKMTTDALKILSREIVQLKKHVKNPPQPSTLALGKKRALLMRLEETARRVAPPPAPDSPIMPVKKKMLIKYLETEQQSAKPLTGSASLTDLKPLIDVKLSSSIHPSESILTSSGGTGSLMPSPVSAPQSPAPHASDDALKKAKEDAAKALPLPSPIALPSLHAPTSSLPPPPNAATSQSGSVVDPSKLASPLVANAPPNSPSSMKTIYSISQVDPMRLGGSSMHSGRGPPHSPSLPYRSDVASTSRGSLRYPPPRPGMGTPPKDMNRMTVSLPAGALGHSPHSRPIGMPPSSHMPPPYPSASSHMMPSNNVPPYISRRHVPSAHGPPPSRYMDMGDRPPPQDPYTDSRNAVSTPPMSTLPSSATDKDTRAFDPSRRRWEDLRKPRDVRSGAPIRHSSDHALSSITRHELSREIDTSHDDNMDIDDEVPDDPAPPVSYANSGSALKQGVPPTSGHIIDNNIPGPRSHVGDGLISQPGQSAYSMMPYPPRGHYHTPRNWGVRGPGVGPPLQRREDYYARRMYDPGKNYKRR